jgi:hypothetical protein
MTAVQAVEVAEGDDGAARGFRRPPTVADDEHAGV